MVKTKTYTNARELAEDLWVFSNQEQKEELLESLGYDLSFAETNTISEMVKRGGALPAKAIIRLQEEYIRQKGGKVKITWRNIK